MQRQAVTSLVKLRRNILTRKLLFNWRLPNYRFSTAPAELAPYLRPVNARIPNDFTFIPQFLDVREQAILLRFALQKLDDSGSRSYQKRRKAYGSSLPLSAKENDHFDSIFCPENLYDFQEKHYDGVIFNYRECHLTSWPEVYSSSLSIIKNRLHSLLPPNTKTQTHILHLSSNGHILPHVDNLEASGSWIAAVSLGGSRVLRMEDKTNKDNFFELLLTPGSVYVQSNHVRYSYLHSISLRGRDFEGNQLDQSPRLSVMLRDFPSPDPLPQSNKTQIL